MATGKDLVAVFKANLGKGGSQVWSWYNYGGRGWSWCQASVCWGFYKIGAKSLFYDGKKTWNCSQGMYWCKANLAQLPIELSLAGDIIYFDWNNNNIPDHVGLIRTRGTHAQALTIEGNTSGGIFDERKRSVSLVMGVFRPHFAMSSKPKNLQLDVDGKIGQKSIYCLQKALGLKADGILGKNTVKAIQKKIGITQDGVWGEVTSKKLQKFLAITQDGDFGINSQKALQQWINKQNKSTTTTADNKTETVVTTDKKGYSGEWPTFVISKTREEVIDDAIAWARFIAKDNSFHYGSGSAAHHNGCYFCGTQPSSKKHSNIKDWEKTYCCNPFIHSAFAHGGLIDSMLRMCRKGQSFGFKKSEGYAKSSLFWKEGHPSMDKLKKGDVMCSNTHVAMVTEDAGRKLIEAIHDDNVRGSKSWNNSISEKEMSKGKYNSFSRVYRLKSGYTKFKHIVRFGDVSDDVARVQKFLKWYGVYNGSIDRICGDATHTAIIKFQKAEGLEATGAFGKKNLAFAKKVKK